MLTVETWLNGLGREQPITECPSWPPDLFAITGALLKRSGAYLRIFERSDGRPYLKDLPEVAQQWRQNIEDLRQPITRKRLRSALPATVQDSWKLLLRSLQTPITQLRAALGFSEQLIRMALIADETSAGIGVDWDLRTEAGARHSTFLTLADQMLAASRLRSFCWEIPADVICVLGKQHTPQRGATFRSLSHHLALYLPSDIEARWIGPLPTGEGAQKVGETLNLLLLPWPTEIDTADFAQTRPHGSSAAEDSLSGYFHFRPKRNLNAKRFARAVRRAADTAHQHAGKIDAIVFPELSLTVGQYEAAERIALEYQTILIGGVRHSTARKGSRDLNVSVLQPAGALLLEGGGIRSRRAIADDLRLVQAKHHRWCLDREQLVNYQLGGQIPVSRSSWENIELPPRVLHFVTLNRITWSVLICEDLARQDPAADLIRSVGPNLLIALLMDGPQLSGRWPSRYASVLAEDPGSSVLTLTSLGMAERCRPLLRSSGRRAEPSRVIALWRDPMSGESEISLDAGHNACVLSLECRMREEYSADGRGDGSQTRYPAYAGFKSFRTEL